MIEQNSAPRYVLLIRHASRQPAWDADENAHDMKGWVEKPPGPASDFGSPGLSRTYALAGRLADQLAEQAAMVTEVIHSPHLVAQRTAQVFEHVLRQRKRISAGASEPWMALAPEPSGVDSEDNRIKSVVARLGRVDGGNTQPTAVVVIGHQPQLTHLARRLLDDKLPADTLPIGASEIACVQIQPVKRLLWLITDKPETLLTELKAKIQLKYDVAKFFLGALVIGTGLTVNKDIWEAVHPAHKLLAGVGALSALVSVALTAATLFSYDRLLMPPEFWSGGAGERRPARWALQRPPSQAHVVLFYEMVFAWKRFFIPAIAFAFLSLALSAIVMAHRSLSNLPCNLTMPAAPWWMFLLAFLLLGGIALTVPLLVYKRFKPRLGFDD